MILLNWMPELFLISSAIIILLIANAGLVVDRSLGIVTCVVTTVVLSYVLYREDLAHFSSVTPLLVSDGLSFFGRGFSLFVLAIFSAVLHFEKKTTLEKKQLGILFLIFFSVFSSIVFQANSLLVFVPAALGINICTTQLVLIENPRDRGWIYSLRQRLLTWSVWAVFTLVLLLVMSFRFGSIYLNDWYEGFGHAAGVDWVFTFLAAGVLISGVLPLLDLFRQGKGSFSLALYFLGLFEIAHVFWMRLGIPFFSRLTVIPWASGQVLLSIIFGVVTVLLMVRTLRNKDYLLTVSLNVPFLVGMSLFTDLLPLQQSLKSFYMIATSLLLTQGFVCLSFNRPRKETRWLVVAALVALLGAPPLMLGKQFYQMIQETIEGGNILAGAFMVFSWMGFVVATLRVVGAVLIEKFPSEDSTGLFSKEVFYASAFLLLVISLTLLHGGILTYLSTFPTGNLW